MKGLGRKLRMLIDYGHFEGWKELGKPFDRQAKTLQWWGHGDDDRQSGTIPGDRYETLIEVVQSCLSNRTSWKEAEALVLAPVIELETELRAQAQVSFNRIIEAEADSRSGNLFFQPKANIGLIETDQKPKSQPEHIIPLDKWFRLEFITTLKTGYISAFQHVGQSWGAVSIHFDKEAGTIHLPGLKEDGELAHMREPKEAGIHRFIVMQTPEPSPPKFRRYLTDEIALDGSIIGLMARFFDEQPENRRRLFLLELEIR